MTKVPNEDLSEKESTDDNQESTDTSDITLNDIASTNEDSSIGELEQPQTKALPSSHIFVLVGLVALCGAVLAYFWMGNDDKKNNNVNKLPFGTEKPTTQGDIPVPSLQRSSASPDARGAVAIVPKKNPVHTPKPTAPSPPPLLPPKKIASPTPPPIAPESSLATHKAVNKNNRETTKIKSSIMLTGGSSKSEQKGKGGTKIDSNTASGTFTPAVTTASAAVVTTIGDMATTITQGKILDSVLETPINTLYPGPIRAVISRDIYSEKGTNVLIPKGSRIIGSIKGGYKAGSTRVAVNWTRIILPSGYDINITSAPGTDKLGMLGVEGIVNRQFIETIGSAALLSIINISAAKMVEDYFNIKSNSQTTSTSSSGVVTTQNTQTPTQQAAQTEFTNLSNLTKDWLKQNFVPTPYIVVDQGTRIKVFVNQDIRFPKNLNGTNFIR